jgi:hypothetical protein
VAIFRKPGPGASSIKLFENWRSLRYISILPAGVT